MRCSDPPDKIEELKPTPMKKEDDTLLQHRVDIDKHPRITIVEALMVVAPKPTQVTVKSVKLPPGAIKLPMPPGAKTSAA
jgi:hypothetical protein